MGEEGTSFPDRKPGIQGTHSMVVAFTSSRSPRRGSLNRGSIVRSYITLLAFSLTGVALFRLLGLNHLSSLVIILLTVA